MCCMRAVQVHEFGDLGAIALATIDDPRPGPGQVLIKTEAVPVNYVDLVTMEGRYQFKPNLPYVPGKGPAGTVLAIGGDVEHIRVGDRVLAMAEYGGYAERTVADAAQVYRLPESLSFTDAAAMSLAFDTAWMALRERARLAPGETVLVLGASGAVGGAAVQLAKAMGAERVLAGVSGPDRFAAVTKLGADGCVDLSRPNLRDDVREQVRALTGSGVDVVIDALGGDPFDGAVRAVNWRGRVVIVGFATGRIPTLKMNYPMLKNIEVSGLQISDYRKRTPDLMAQCYEEIFALYGEGRVLAPPSRTFAFSDWREAVETLKSRATSDRIILQPDIDAPAG
jgi:NADPH2:quinone reductase